jgi:hypothetical protein
MRASLVRWAVPIRRQRREPPGARGGVGGQGKVTERWSVYGGLVVMETEVTKSSTPAFLGRELANLPKTQFNLLSKYQLTAALSVGGQAIYASEVFSGLFAVANEGNHIPAHWEATAAAEQLGSIVLEALSRSALFISAAIPGKIFPPLFKRQLHVALDGGGLRTSRAATIDPFRGVHHLATAHDLLLAEHLRNGKQHSLASGRCGPPRGLAARRPIVSTANYSDQETLRISSSA